MRSSVRQKNLAVSALPAVTIQSQQKEPLFQLRQFIEHFKGNVLFSVETEGRRENLAGFTFTIKKLNLNRLKTLSEAKSKTSFKSVGKSS